MSPLSKRLAFFVPLVVALVMVLGHSGPARASTRCFENLKDCYYKSAAKDSYIDMWLAGLDCELDFTDCTRRAILGR